MKVTKTKLMILSQRNIWGILSLQTELSALEKVASETTAENQENFLRKMVQFENNVKAYVDNYRDEIKEMK